MISEQSRNNMIAVVLGTRPGFIMFSPILRQLETKKMPHIVIHSGQHYSANMDAQFFKDLEMPKPDYKLSGLSDCQTHGSQTAKMLEGIEHILIQTKPQRVLVGGDANTNLAAALAARKLGLSLGHVEAGERSYDWRMPEEHNRRIIDHISDQLYVTGEKAKDQLERESVAGAIYTTGNPIVDASLYYQKIALKRSTLLRDLNVVPEKYLVLTTHREENVDCIDRLKGIIEGGSQAAFQLGLKAIFPVHPRTKKMLDTFALMPWVQQFKCLEMIDVLGYLDFLNLLSNARLVLTDSGGVQQESCIHNVPAVTLRDNTEWKETLDNGANVLAGTNPKKIVESALKMNQSQRHWQIPFGDGSAARQIVDIASTDIM